MTRRLLLSYLAITVLVLVVLGVPLSILSADREQSRFLTQTRQDALILGASYEDALEHGLSLDAEVADDYATRTGNAVAIVDRDGVTRLDTEAPAGLSIAHLPEIEQALSGRAATPRHSDTRNVEYVAMPITSGGTMRGAVRLAAGHEPVDAANRQFRLELTGIALAVVGFAAFIGWAIARSVSEPIGRLTQRASRFAAGELALDTEPVRGPPEVRTLADTLDTMASRLDELMRSQRRFVADASHQLRTPLTAVRLRLGNALNGPPEDRDAELDATIEEMDRMGEIVGSLLALARADEHDRPAVGDPTTDLAAAVLDRVDTWSVAAETANVQLVPAVPDVAVPVRAATAAVEQILDNLLDNALQASPPRTTVTAHVENDADHPRLVVVDEGRGLSPEEMELATQRFWRKDASRPGTGLGLSIVESLARASGAGLELGQGPRGGLAVTVSFRPAGGREADRNTADKIDADSETDTAPSRRVGGPRAG